MIQRILSCICVATFLAGCSTVDKNESRTPLQCGVLKFEAASGVKEGEAESFTEMFSTALQNTGRFAVMERRQLNLVLQEQGFQSTQSEENAAKAGKVLAIRKMFSGSIGMLGEKYIINVKMIDVESSRIDFGISKTYDDDLEDIGNQFLPELMQEILQKAESLQSN
jgi:curli biogenesis system outer membrane secretion channel CsgG